MYSFRAESLNSNLILRVLFTSTVALPTGKPPRLSPADLPQRVSESSSSLLHGWMQLSIAPVVENVGEELIGLKTRRRRLLEDLLVTGIFVFAYEATQSRATLE